MTVAETLTRDAVYLAAVRHAAPVTFLDRYLLGDELLVEMAVEVNEKIGAAGEWPVFIAALRGGAASSTVAETFLGLFPDTDVAEAGRLLGVMARAYAPDDVATQLDQLIAVGVAP